MVADRVQAGPEKIGGAEMRKIDLIALDLDGTLLDPSGRITQASKEAIAQSQEAGVQVLLATGRSACEAAYFAQEAGCGILAAALGGAAVCDTRTGAHIRRWDFTPETGRRALELCLNRELELMIFAGEAIVLDPFSHRSLMKSYPFDAFHRSAVVTQDPLAYLEEHNLPLTKLHGAGDPAHYPLQELAALEGVELTSSGFQDFELVPAKVGKGRALALMAILRGVPLERCAAVGDSPNDLSMLEVVGTPIAMGNAEAAVKELACYVSADNGRDGVAQAIRWCLEQRVRA